MKCEVTLYKAGTIFKEEVIAKDYQDARQVALARNPNACLLYTSPSPRDKRQSRMPSSA